MPTSRSLEADLDQALFLLALLDVMEQDQYPTVEACDMVELRLTTLAHRWIRIYHLIHNKAPQVLQRDLPWTGA